MEKLRVAVTSGYSSSKHAIALLHGINQLPNIEIVLLIQVKTFTIKRIKQLLRMYGWRDAWEKFKNVFVGDSTNRFVDEILPINNFLKEKKIDFKSTIQLSKRLNISVKRVVTLNDQASLDALSNNKVDLVIYAGGGILRRKFIESTPYGVLNAHSGPLPFFRGMNCMEWTLFYGVQPEITVHMIDKGIDTGPILKRFQIEIVSGDSLSALRGKSVVREVTSIVEVLSDFQRYFNAKVTQDQLQGLQFFIMHPLLKNVIDDRLARGWKPQFSCDDFLTLNQRM